MVDLIALAIPVFFLMIGIEWGVARRMGLQPYRFVDAITDLSCGITSQVIGIFFGILLIAPYAWIWDRWRLATLPDTAASTHLVAFLGVDLAYYAWHRFTHETNLGWSTHVVHHQSEDYNLAVALRQSITSSWTSWPFYLPLALLGVSPVVFLTHTALNTLYQFWIHTETIGRLGPLEWVLNTPSHHRVHHAINDRYLDRNYAGVLIVWDRLFGSFEPEGEPAIYGTVAPLRSVNPLWANAAYGWGLLADTWAAPRWSDKARIWLARPGWRPEGLPPYEKVVPGSREAQVKYDPVGGPGVAIYVALQFVPLAAATTALLFVHGTASAVVLVVGSALVIWTTVSFGAAFERRSWARGAEIGRLATLAVTGGAALAAGAPVLGALLLGLAALSAVLWWRIAAVS
jgi:sterol desaturase/sphingolipid hydroxylase (fatty acid hydroxylase superfamily)